MSPRYRVTLTGQERDDLEALTKRGKTHARRFIHARALLLCDAGPHGPAWTVPDVAEALGITSRTIEHLKKRFVEDGLKPPWSVNHGKSHQGKSSLTAHLKQD